MRRASSLVPGGSDGAHPRFPPARTRRACRKRRARRKLHTTRRARARSDAFTCRGLNLARRSATRTLLTPTPHNPGDPSAGYIASSLAREWLPTSEYLSPRPWIHGRSRGSIDRTEPRRPSVKPPLPRCCEGQQTGSLHPGRRVFAPIYLQSRVCARRRSSRWTWKTSTSRPILAEWAGRRVCRAERAGGLERNKARARMIRRRPTGACDCMCGNSGAVGNNVADTTSPDHCRTRATDEPRLTAVNRVPVETGCVVEGTCA